MTIEQIVSELETLQAMCNKEYVTFDKLQNGDIFTWKLRGKEYPDEIFLMVDKNLNEAGQCIEFHYPDKTWFNRGQPNMYFLVLDRIDLEAITL